MDESQAPLKLDPQEIEMATKQSDEPEAKTQPDILPVETPTAKDELSTTEMKDLSTGNMPFEAEQVDTPISEALIEKSDSNEKRQRPAEDDDDDSESPYKRVKVLDTPTTSTQQSPPTALLEDQDTSPMIDVSLTTNDDPPSPPSSPLSSVPDDIENESYATPANEAGQRWSNRRRKPVEIFGAPVPTDSIDLIAEDSETEEGESEPEAPISKTKASRPKSSKKSAPLGKETKTQISKNETSKVKVKSATKSGVSKSTRETSEQISLAENLIKATALGKWKSKTDETFRVKIRKELTGKNGRKKAQQHSSLIVRLPSPQPDSHRLSLSRKLTARQTLDQKPQPRGNPEVWAESRPALCETLPYFKSPQSGCYMNDGHVYGFLFDSIGHCREYMDEDVIICRAGGSMEPDGNGGMVQRKDHSFKEAQIQAVLNDMAHHNPVVVICGNRNEAAPCKMPHQYCVLGWYKATHVWTEKTAGKGEKLWKTVKFRLERLNRHIPAWHSRKDLDFSLSGEEQAVAGELHDESCTSCGERSPQVYLRWWMCLNSECSKFWTVNGVDAPHGTKGLEYNPAFLLHRSELWSVHDGKEQEPAPLQSPVPDIGNSIGDNLKYINTRGICCPKCGRCSSRRFFKGWVCENPACDFELAASHRTVAPAMLHTPWDVAPTLVRNRKDPSVQLSVEYRHGYKISTYTFGKGIEGRFIHAAATKKILQEEKGPNDMFAALQTEDLGLERRTFAVSKSPGSGDKNVSSSVQAREAMLEGSGDTDKQPSNQSQEPDPPQDLATRMPLDKPDFAAGDLMTAFSMNYGMPYKFVASGSSKAFEDGPWPVREARRRLNWAVREFLGHPENDHMDLNEELIFAYLQGQKIEYHDDGEEGLGPCIATMSLGGKAQMLLRMKAKHFVGCSKTGVLTEDEPIPGSLEYERRHELWEELQQLKTKDPSAYNARRKGIPKELGIYEKRGKKAEDLVTITLSHGDIVIMDGYDVQKYLEHKVVPEGYLRFALTCRTVLGNHLRSEEYPDYEVKVDEMRYEGPRI